MTDLNGADFEEVKMGSDALDLPMRPPNADSHIIPSIKHSDYDAVNLEYILCVFAPELVVERRRGINTCKTAIS